VTSSCSDEGAGQGDHLDRCDAGRISGEEGKNCCCDDGDVAGEQAAGDVP
jgi:hypothetical protein